MKTTALRLYGVNDLRLESFELPECGDDGIIAEVVCDSICMSSFKAAEQGAAHKRVPADCAENPVIIGHEFCGVIREVGKKWQNQFKPGERFGIQPALNYKGTLDAPGYSFQTIGGDSTFIRIPSCVMEMNCLLKYTGDAFFMASLSEPMSCLVGACRAQYRLETPGSYHHTMGVKKGGKCACIASAGPMGLGLIDYLVHGPMAPSLVVVTDIDQARLDRAASVLAVEDAAAHGVRLVYQNTSSPTATADLRELSGGTGYDDVFVMAPVPALVEQADAILANGACLNFFSGPMDPNFSARLNFYNVHYAGTHLVGTSGGNTDDIREALKLMGEGVLNPAIMITHVGGLTAARDTTLNLPNIKGGKKLIYTHQDFPLTAIADFAEKGKTDPVFAELDDACKRHNGLWNLEAERIVLEKMPRI